MAAQLICNQWVAGSTPVTSSKKNRSGTLIPGRFFHGASLLERLVQKLR